MEQALMQAAILTFEELGFVFLSPDTDGGVVGDINSATVTVDFRGEFPGKLVLRVENQMLPTLAANLLGEDETEVSEELQRDALGELANVVCGNALPAIAGKQAVFRLNAPQFSTEAFIEKPSAMVNLNSDEGRADVLLYLN